MTDILPVSTGMGFNNDGFGNGTLGAFAGALFGSWFGDGWGGNGWGRGGYVPDGAAATGFSTQILNDGINAIQNSINGMNMNISSGLCNVGYQNLDQSSRTNLAMMQGFSSLGHENCQNTFNVVSAINSLGSQLADCCCKTQRAIEQQGCQTRELMQTINTQNIRDQLCDAKAKNASLEAQIFNTGLANNTASLIIRHLPTTTTTAAAAG